MTLLWILFGGFLALVVLMAVAGSLMPERYEGKSVVHYASPIESVWEALLDYGKHPMTGKMMKSVRALPNDGPLANWQEAMGHGEEITVHTVEATRPTHMIRQMASLSTPMTSRWEYRLEPMGDNCKLSLIGETYIRKGTWHVPFFRVMMKLGGGVKKGLDIQMDMIAETLEVKATRAS